MTCRVRGWGWGSLICHCGLTSACFEPLLLPRASRGQRQPTAGPLGAHSVKQIQPEGCSQAPLSPASARLSRALGTPAQSQCPGRLPQAQRLGQHLPLAASGLGEACSRSLVLLLGKPPLLGSQSLPTLELGGRSDLTRCRCRDWPWGERKPGGSVSEQIPRSSAGLAAGLAQPCTPVPTPSPLQGGVACVFIAGDQGRGQL